MNQRFSTFAPLGFLILLAALSFWLEQAVQTQAVPERNVRHDPDFWADNFTVRRFGADGALQSTLTGSKMVHFPDDDTTVVSNPILRYQNKPPVSIAATTGLVSADGEEIVLTGGAKILREDPKGSLPIEIQTEVLSLFPNSERAVSRQPVRITQGRSVITGSGLDVDHTTGISVLAGRVNGIIHRKQ